MQIYPAILTDSIAVVQEQLTIAQELPDVSVVQVDIIDGRFADNLTITPADLPDVTFEELEVDIHLMTEEPMDYVFELIEHKRNIPVRAVIGQVERMSKQTFFLEEVEKNDWLPGLSLDLYTPLDAIDLESWRFLKVVQLMAIEAGFQGAPFHQNVLKKIAELKAYCVAQNLEIEIIVDGSMNVVTVPQVAAAGAQSVAVGSALWQADDKAGLLKQLQSM